MKIAAVADPLTLQALRLMGIAGTPATTAEEASAALDGYYESDTVILISESAARLVRARVDRLKTARESVMILEIPSMVTAARDHEKAAKMNVRS